MKHLRVVLSVLATMMMVFGLAVPAQAASNSQLSAGDRAHLLEFIVGPDKAADLQPSIGPMLLGALPVFVLIIVQILVLVLALTDKEMAGLTRLAWTIAIVFAPPVGMVAYMFARGVKRIRGLRPAARTGAG